MIITLSPMSSTLFLRSLSTPIIDSRCTFMKRSLDIINIFVFGSLSNNFRINTTVNGIEIKVWQPGKIIGICWGNLQLIYFGIAYKELIPRAVFKYWRWPDVCWGLEKCRGHNCKSTTRSCSMSAVNGSRIAFKYSQMALKEHGVRSFAISFWSFSSYMHHIHTHVRTNFVWTSIIVILFFIWSKT